MGSSAASLILSLLVCVQPFGALAGDWPQLQHDAAHTGYTPDQPEPPFTLLWTRDLGEPIQPSHQPIVADGKLFTGTAWGNLYALDRTTGEPAWVYRTAGPIVGSPAFADGLVCVNSMDGYCHAVTANRGEMVWRFQTGAGLWAAPVIADSKVFVAGRDGFVYAVDLATGTQLWRAAVGSLVQCTPACRDGKLYVGVGDMRVYAFDTATGRQLWISPQMHGMAIRDYWLAASDETILLTVQLVTNSHAVAHALDQVLSRFRATQAGQKVLVEDGVFPMLVEYFKANPSTRTYYALDSTTGAEKFIPPIIGVHGGGCTPPVPAIALDGWAYTAYTNVTLAASGQGFLGRFDLETGKMEPLLNGRFAAPPARGYWAKNRSPAPGFHFDRASDWSGGFGVSDHSWGNSIGGEWIYNVRDAGWVPDPKTSLNMFHVETNRDTTVGRGTGVDYRQGKYNGSCHATNCPVVIAGEDVFYKSIRNVLFAFRGK